MSRTASARVQQAVEGEIENEVTMCGMGLAQESGGSVYGLLSTPFSDNDGIEQGTPLQLAYHHESGSYIITPVDD